MVRWWCLLVVLVAAVWANNDDEDDPGVLPGRHAVDPLKGLDMDYVQRLRTWYEETATQREEMFENAEKTSPHAEWQKGVPVEDLIGAQEQYKDLRDRAGKGHAQSDPKFASIDAAQRRIAQLEEQLREAQHAALETRFNEQMNQHGKPQGKALPGPDKVMEGQDEVAYEYFTGGGQEQQAEEPPQGAPPQNTPPQGAPPTEEVPPAAEKKEETPGKPPNLSEGDMQDLLTQMREQHPEMFAAEPGQARPAAEHDPIPQPPTDPPVSPIAPNVMALTPRSFDAMLASYQFAVVYFHTPVVPGSFEALLAVDAAAKAVNEEQLASVVCSVDIESQPELAARLGISVGPVLLGYQYWDQANTVPYSYGWAGEDIVQWIKTSLNKLAPAVGRMTIDNAPEYINDKSTTLIFLCAPGLPQCSRAWPELNEAAHEVAPYPDLSVVTLEDVQLAVALLPNLPPSLLEPQSHPKCIMVTSGGEAYLLSREPTGVTLTHSLVTASPAYHDATMLRIGNKTAFDAALEAHGVFIALVYAEKSDHPQVDEMFQMLFDIFMFHNKRICAFATIVGVPEVAKNSGMQLPAFVLFKSFDEAIVPYTYGINTYQFGKFLRYYFLPSMTRFDPALYGSFASRGFPIIYLIHDSNPAHEAFLLRFNFFAQRRRFQATCIQIDVEEWPEVMPFLHLKREHLPAVIVEDPPPEHLIPPPMATDALLGNLYVEPVGVDGELTTALLEQLLSGYLNKTLEWDFGPDSPRPPKKAADAGKKEQPTTAPRDEL